MFDSFVVIQSLGLMGMGIVIASWQLKNPRHIILSNIPACAMWATHFIFLGAYTAALTNSLNIFKDIALLTIKDKYVPYVTAAILMPIWVIGAVLFEKWYDILPLIGASAFHISCMFRDNRKLMARVSMTGHPFWFVYNIFVSSWVGVASHVFVSFSTIIGMARHENWNLKLGLSR